MGKGNASPWLSIAQGISEAGNTYAQASNLKSRDIAQQTAADIDAMILEEKAKDAIRRGEGESLRIGEETRLIRGSQRAGYAGQGVAVGSGTPGAVGAETEAFGKMDQLTTERNALMEAFAYRGEAQRIDRESQLMSERLQDERRATIVTGGMKVAQRGLESYSGFRGRPRFKGRPAFKPRNPTEDRFDKEFMRNRGGR